MQEDLSASDDSDGDANMDKKSKKEVKHENKGKVAKDKHDNKRVHKEAVKKIK